MKAAPGIPAETPWLHPGISGGLAWAPITDTAAASVLAQLRGAQPSLRGSRSPFRSSRATLLAERGKCPVLHWASSLLTGALAKTCCHTLPRPCGHRAQPRGHCFTFYSILDTESEGWRRTSQKQEYNPTQGVVSVGLALE